MTLRPHRPMYDQRHMQGALVNEISMARFTVVPQALAMIRHQNHQRLVPQPHLHQLIA